MQVRTCRICGAFRLSVHRLLRDSCIELASRRLDRAGQGRTNEWMGMQCAAYAAASWQLPGPRTWEQGARRWITLLPLTEHWMGHSWARRSLGEFRARANTTSSSSSWRCLRAVYSRYPFGTDRFCCFVIFHVSQELASSEQNRTWPMKYVIYI